MNWYQQNRQKRQRRNLLLATFAVVILFALNYFTGGLVARPLRSIGSTLWRGSNVALTDVAASGVFATKAGLAKQNQTLRQQLAALQERSDAYQALEAENEQLRSLVHLAESAAGITAPVVSSFKTSPYGTFYIGAGALDGVQKDAIVLSAEHFVVGRVTDVSAHQALVTEMFAPQTHIEVLIGSVPVTLTGKGGGNAEGDAPRGSSIATSTAAVAPSLGGRTIGIVGKAEGDTASASVKVYVRSPVNLEQLLFVYVQK